MSTLRTLSAADWLGDAAAPLRLLAPEEVESSQAGPGYQGSGKIARGGRSDSSCLLVRDCRPAKAGGGTAAGIPTAGFAYYDHRR
jgi:hypothetical protein